MTQRGEGLKSEGDSAPEGEDPEVPRFREGAPGIGWARTGPPREVSGQASCASSGASWKCSGQVTALFLPARQQVAFPAPGRLLSGGLDVCWGPCWYMFPGNEEGPAGKSRTCQAGDPGPDEAIQKPGLELGHRGHRGGAKPGEKSPGVTV